VIEIYIAAEFIGHDYIREGLVRIWPFEWHRVWCHSRYTMDPLGTAGGFRLVW